MGLFVLKCALISVPDKKNPIVFTAADLRIYGITRAQQIHLVDRGASEFGTLGF